MPSPPSPAEADGSPPSAATTPSCSTSPLSPRTRCPRLPNLSRPRRHGSRVDRRHQRPRRHSERNMLPVLDSEQAVRDLDPDLQAITRLPVGGLIVTARSHRPGGVVSRYVAPLFGIPEDPVTGSAHCTIGPLLARHTRRAVVCRAGVSVRRGTECCHNRRRTGPARGQGAHSGHRFHPLTVSDETPFCLLPPADQHMEPLVSVSRHLIASLARSRSVVAREHPPMPQSARLADRRPIPPTDHLTTWEPVSQGSAARGSRLIRQTGRAHKRWTDTVARARGLKGRDCETTITGPVDVGRRDPSTTRTWVTPVREATSPSGAGLRGVPIDPPEQLPGTGTLYETRRTCGSAHRRAQVGPRERAMRGSGEARRPTGRGHGTST